MSTRESVSVFCDGLGCNEVEVTSRMRGTGYDPDVARESIENQGWTRDGDSDYCPACSKRRSEKESE